MRAGHRQRRSRTGGLGWAELGRVTAIALQLNEQRSLGGCKVQPHLPLQGKSLKCLAWEAKTTENHGVRKLRGQKQERNAYHLELGWGRAHTHKT